MLAKVDGEDPAQPIKEFAEAGLSEEILLKLQEKRIQVRSDCIMTSLQR